MWKNMVEPDRAQMTTWRMLTAYWIPKAINTHPEYETHYFSTATMVALKRLIVRYSTYNACLVYMMYIYTSDIISTHTHTHARARARVQIL